MSAALDPAPLRRWDDVPPNYVRTLSAPSLFVPQGPNLSLHYREYSQRRPVVSSYQNWWSKHNAPHPNFIHGSMKEKYGPQRQTQWPFEKEPMSEKWSTDPSFRVDYPKPHPTDLYHTGGQPVTETKRGRGQYGLQGTYNIYGNDHLYPHSNAMTGANHRRPVYSVYGPLLRDKYCGINYQHNRHGNMNFDDHY
ncbi:hypothetical protein EB796_002670 [Bugula neritina]|uniref:Uncharacterized protein n=1 Tax=Bugula neritina TaxID=10212 RepID=A0A7J7KKY7_BUGNE|nr:hypothetical protein EB796_002670 [Bugula neritina]